MSNFQFLGFKTHIREHSAHATTFLGYATVMLAKGLCTQAAHITGPTGGAKSFDSGAWVLTCSVRRINKTGEIRVEIPVAKASNGMYYKVVKLVPMVHERIHHATVPHLPTEEEITHALHGGQ